MLNPTQLKTHSHIYTHTYSVTLTLAHSHIYTNIHSHSHTHKITLNQYHTCTHTFSHTLSLKQALTYSPTILSSESWKVIDLTESQPTQGTRAKTFCPLHLVSRPPQETTLDLILDFQPAFLQMIQCLPDICPTPILW
jgi:hypothetical protein